HLRIRPLRRPQTPLLAEAHFSREPPSTGRRSLRSSVQCYERSCVKDSSSMEHARGSLMTSYDSIPPFGTTSHLFSSHRSNLYQQCSIGHGKKNGGAIAPPFPLIRGIQLY